MAEQLIVGGNRRQAAGGSTFAVTDPSTGEPLTEVCQAGVADVEDALTIAHEAFEAHGAWADAAHRGRTLQRSPSCCWDCKEELARLEAIGAGHPIGDARWEAEAAARTLRVLRRRGQQALRRGRPGAGRRPRRRAARAGRRVRADRAVELPAAHRVLEGRARRWPAATRSSSSRRRSPRSPRWRSARSSSRPGCRPSACHVLPGPGRGGRRHAGRRPPGRQDRLHRRDRHRRRASCGRRPDNITRVSLELGGKSACVVFADADLERRVDGDPDGGVRQRRPGLLRPQPHPRRAAGLRRLRRRASPTRTEAIVVGDAARRGHRDGPDDLARASAGRRSTTSSIGADEGARRGVRRRGARPAAASTSPRRWSPTSTTRCASPGRRSSARSPRSSPSTTRTTPSASPTTATTACPGSLWTRDVGRAIRVAKALRTGTLSVNSHRSVRTETPFGGFKRSGLGRELGMAAMDPTPRSRTSSSSRTAELDARPGQSRSAGASRGRAGGGRGRSAPASSVLADAAGGRLEAVQRPQEALVLGVGPADVAAAPPAVLAEPVEAAVVADPEGGVGLDVVAGELAQAGPRRRGSGASGPPPRTPRPAARRRVRRGRRRGRRAPRRARGRARSRAGLRA